MMNRTFAAALVVALFLTGGASTPASAQAARAAAGPAAEFLHFPVTPGNEAYATIDIKPGYQKLKGQDALDYVRYRHGDNDFFRASRQQDFLRQVTHQDATRALLDFGKRKRLARIFGRYFEVDKSFVSASNLIGLARTGLFMIKEKAPVNEVRFPAYEAKNPAVNSTSEMR